VIERKYTDFTPHNDLLKMTIDYSALLSEYGHGDKVVAIAERVKTVLAAALEEAKTLADKAECPSEPDSYTAIRKLCKGGNIPAKSIPDLAERMAGAILGRFAGCTLGVPVEMWPIENMQKLAESNNMEFPPKDYWTQVDREWGIQYGMDSRKLYTRDGMDGVPVDDDITYTILGLLIIERYGFDFTTENVAEIWLEILPYACTAEDVALKNLKAGIPASQAGLVNNPYRLWIGADIRADGFGFAAAGNPELAAAMGYQDAYLTHRRDGIYGEMFFAAAIAAAFTVECPIEAIRIALKEIPQDCGLYHDIAWALEAGPSFKDYLEARKAVDKRFAGMSAVHTNNNACLTVFGLMLGKGDFTETIANVVALGMDNDCTGATAGSLIGAVVGRKGIPAHWTKNFNDKVRTYLTGYPQFSIEDLITRFVCLAEQAMKI